MSEPNSRMVRHCFTVVAFLLICGQNSDAALIIEAIQHQACEHPVCADPPHGCVAYILKDKRDCPLQCTYSCGAPWCAVRTCREPCPGGYYKDKTGCNSCNCKPLCEDKRCLGDCPLGYEKDRMGCRTCICVPSPTSPPAPTTTVRQNQQVDETPQNNNGSNLKAGQPQQPPTATAPVCNLNKTSDSGTNM